MTSPFNADNDSSITAFRGEIRNLLAQQSSAARQRDIVILAIDGIPYDLAVASWLNARIKRSRSVFPSTSSTAWLSSLTGQTVGCHGIPGIVFDVGSGGLINIFEYRGQLDCPNTGNIFSDASAFGYLPISIMGDWEPYDCSARYPASIFDRNVRREVLYVAVAMVTGCDLRVVAVGHHGTPR